MSHGFSVRAARRRYYKAQKEYGSVQSAAKEEHKMNRVCGMLLGLLCTATGLCAQSDVPILSGAVAFQGTSSGGANSFQPIIFPVLVAPLGDHWLVESRGEIQGFIARQNGTTGPYNGIFVATFAYLQVDYIANSHLTVTAGRFLTPFNIYNERFPLWIANLVDQPIIFPIGTRTSASSNGGMVRGVAVARSKWNLNYAAYASVSTTTENLQSGRAAGGRMGIFLPQQGLELGASYQRFLQNGGSSIVGSYFAWQPPPIPLDVRAEYAHSPGGQGYWIEGAYRFAPNRDMNTWPTRLQAVARVQQYFKGKPTPTDFLPATDVNQYDFGLNYYLPHNVRLNGSYGRQYRFAANANVWNFEITYRFLFPAWPGEHK